MLSGLLKFFLLRRFPKLALFGMVASALIGFMRSRRAR
jgi:hypothetical protein